MKQLKFTLILSLLLLKLSVSNAQVLGNYNLLIVDGFGATDTQTELVAMGHTVTIVSTTALVSGYDYSSYNSILFMYDSSPPVSMSEILTLNQSCQLGIVALRGGSVISTVGLGTSVYYSAMPFDLVDNTHFITQPFATGILDLGFTYTSNVDIAMAGTTILGTVEFGNGSLVIHNTYPRAVSPYYGHYDGMPWTSDAQTLLDRIVSWTSSYCLTTSINENEANDITLFPNPSAGKFIISAKGNATVYNVMGEIVLVQKLVSEQNEMDLTDKPNGVYFIKIQTGGKVSTKKIIKN